MTITGQIIRFVSALCVLVGWSLDEAALAMLVGAGVWLIGEVISYYGRYRRGDIAWYGSKKSLSVL